MVNRKKSFTLNYVQYVLHIKTLYAWCFTFECDFPSHKLVNHQAHRNPGYTDPDPNYSLLFEVAVGGLDDVQTVIFPFGTAIKKNNYINKMYLLLYGNRERSCIYIFYFLCFPMITG